MVIRSSFYFGYAQRMESVRVKSVRDLRRLRSNFDNTLTREFLECKINKVVAIFYYGRSGSYFLHSLLENHPNFLAMNSEFREFWQLPEKVFNKPFEKQVVFILSHWFGFINSAKTYDNFTDFGVLRTPVHVPRDLLVNFENIEFDGLSENEKKFKKPELRTFVSALYSLSETRYGADLKRKSLTRLQLFELFHLAWAMSLNKSPQQEFCILFNAHVPGSLTVRNLELVIPTTCIHTVRNPIQSLGSLLTRYLDKDLSHSFENDIYASMRNVLAHFFEGDTFLSKKYLDQEFAIRLEDLHRNPESTLRTLMQRLGLNYHPCLLSETFNSGPYSFRKGETFVRGFGGPQMSNKYNELFSENDCSKLEEIFRINYEKWDYPFSATQKTVTTQSSPDDLLELDFLTNIASLDLAKFKFDITKVLKKRLSRPNDYIFSVLFPKSHDTEITPQCGKVIWITGLSGSGKTTLAQEVANLLRSSGDQLILLDGDELREIFILESSDDKLFSRQTRLKLALQYANLCKLIASQGINVVIATISLFSEVHAWNRMNLQDYFEVYLDVPLEILRNRDPKGIYKRYDKNQELGVVGLDINFDAPTNPDLVLKYGSNLSPQFCAEVILSRIKSGARD